MSLWMEYNIFGETQLAHLDIVLPKIAWMDWVEFIALLMF